MAKLKTNADGFLLVLEHMSKSDLATALGLSRQAVHQWGDEIPERFAVRISAMTGLSVADILPETYRKARQSVDWST